MKSIAEKLFWSLIFVACLPGCNPDANSNERQKDSLAIREEFANSPVRSPEEALKTMQLEAGFTIELAAAEPLVNTPVALTFDERGRLWVVEMQGYMPDTAGTGEESPTGKIVILEDTNRDAHYDVRKIFLDSLVLPRAICLIEKGVLVAEPPRLWYVERDGDKPGKKTLVDDKYAEGGNVEHQPNGLLRNIDNWIYNVKSSARYKKKGDRWLKEKTHFRGQWGLSNDDYGRLYYNHNSANVLGDYFFPSLGSTNTNQKRVSGFNEKIVADNRVYPVRATTGVNRGYAKGILDNNLRLENFTAACGPFIYRGQLFGEAYYGNAFVPEPAANLIKRNILKENGYILAGRQAYQEKEFLASSDERFRPVSIYGGPDGALYVVDMYRGIIQHKTFLTDYLKKEITDRQLSQPLSCGRIYRIAPSGKEAVYAPLPDDPMQLAKLFNHPNGWVRDKAQQIIIDKEYLQVIPVLREYLTAVKNSRPLIHALWTLNEFGELRPPEILSLLQHTDWRIRMQALSVLPDVITSSTYKQYLPVLNDLLQRDTMSAPLIVFVANTIGRIDETAGESLVETAVKIYPGNKYVTDAVISNVQGREAAFLQTVRTIHPDTSLLIHRQLNKVLADILQTKNNASYNVLAKKYPRGVAVYKSICQSCHGADGNGLQGLAPPLNKSEWVMGDKGALAAILVYGLSGPVHVKDKLYKAPEIMDEMPGIGNSKEISDEDIAEVMSFIRNAWNNRASEATTTDIEKVRRKYGSRKAFTMEELKKVK
jgi:mono/diheme cytochrome c family protein/glucose/arabinose dehydrogenase